jgi:hypothetical protein
MGILGRFIWLVSLSMDELQKLRDEVASLRVRVDAMEGEMASLFRDTILELRGIIEELNRENSGRVRELVALSDEHIKRMSHVLEQIEAMNNRILLG